MFSTRFAPRGRNVSGTVLRYDHLPAQSFCLLVTEWGRNHLGQIRFIEAPKHQPDWGGHTPAFVQSPDWRTLPQHEVTVASIVNLRPGPEDTTENYLKYPSGIWNWRRSIEVRPVVIDVGTGAPQPCPDWFLPTLRKLQEHYDREAEKFAALLGPEELVLRQAEINLSLIICEERIAA